MAKTKTYCSSIWWLVSPGQLNSQTETCLPSWCCSRFPGEVVWPDLDMFSIVQVTSFPWPHWHLFYMKCCPSPWDVPNKDAVCWLYVQSLSEAWHMTIVVAGKQLIIVYLSGIWAALLESCGDSRRNVSLLLTEIMCCICSFFVTLWRPLFSLMTVSFL